MAAQKSDLAAVMAGWPIPRRTLAFRGGWRVELEAPTEAAVFEAVNRDDVPDTLRAVGMVVTKLALKAVVQPDGTPIDPALHEQWLAMLPTGQLQVISHAANELATDPMVDADFLEPPSPETEGSDET